MRSGFGMKLGGEGALKVLFTRLYSLNLDKECMISEMGTWEEGVWRWKWRWRRDLFDRETNTLNALLSLIN